MKKIFLFVLVLAFLCAWSVNGEELPGWVYQSSQKQGDVWLFSGSVHDMSLLNVAVPLARSAALSNLVSSIGVAVNAAIGHKIEGSEIDGYTEEILVSQGYVMESITAYGVRQKQMFVERYTDTATGRQKFNVHVLLEVTDMDLKKAQSDFARRVYQPKPVMKSKDKGETQGAGLFRYLIRKIGL